MKKAYPLWAIWLWRLVRTAVATSLGQTLILQVDWTKPEIAVKTLVVSFIAGCFVAVGTAIRDEWGGKDKAGLLHKLPV